MAKVLVIGSANMDVVTPVDQLPAAGQTIHVGDIQLVCGGKGANAAVAAARLGAQVRFVGCVGDDAFGKQIRRSLQADGVDLTYLRTATASTGTAVILVHQAGGQNSIMVSAGANAHVVLPADDAVFSWADVMMLQLETPTRINIEAARRGRAAGVLVILDPAPAAADLPAELFEAADIVSPNETELATITGMPVNDMDSALAAAKALLERGARELVVKLGDKGALWVTPGKHQHFPAMKVKALDTTAAGDVFTGAMAAALADHPDRPAAIRQGIGAGALACTRRGAQPSLPTREELQAFMRISSRGG